MSEVTEIHAEADRHELILEIVRLTGEDGKAVENVVRAYGIALANILAASSDKRVEIAGGIIATARHKRPSTGTDPNGNPYELPERYKINVKAESGLLDALESALGLPCRNG